MENKTTSTRITAAIPLYNKEAEIARALRSVLSQTLLPQEILVIDDGSTDHSAEIVQSFSSPLIRLVRQTNQGVSIARNRAAREAAGDYIAYLDADDTWEPNYLAEMARLITQWPNCGAYAAAFNIVSRRKSHPNRSPSQEGIVDDFFRQAMTDYICQPSATVIPRTVIQSTGGFPEGMKLGEDLYMWIRIASLYPICFTPLRLVNYSRVASNRSISIYRPEQTDRSFEELYHEEPENFYRNEYIARCAIGKALTLSAKGDTVYGKRTEHFFAYTRLYRRGWIKLWILNRLPVAWRATLLSLYNRLAWLLLHKGF